MTYKEIIQREKRIDSELKRQGYNIPETSGIYIFKRTETYGYVGQAKNLKRRVIQHITDYKQPIDYSLKSKKIYSKDNLKGWEIRFFNVEESKLNEMERKFIEMYQNDGVVLYNVTNGGQDSGKFDINQRKSAKGYQDGLKKGYENARKEIAHLFDLHLKAEIKGNETKVKQKAYEKFLNFIDIEKKM